MTTSPRSRIIAVDDVAWQELTPGITFKILWQDGQTKRRVQMTASRPAPSFPGTATWATS